MCPAVVPWCSVPGRRGESLVPTPAGARGGGGALLEARLGGAGGVDCHQVVVSVVPLYLADDGGGLVSPGQVFE